MIFLVRFFLPLNQAPNSPPFLLPPLRPSSPSLLLSSLAYLLFCFLFALPPLLAPSGFDRTVVLETGPRHIVLSWDPPASSNGILINYTVTQDGVVLAATTPTSQSYNVTGLLPFTSYNFTVMVCTAVGCADSQVLAASTLEDGKDLVTSCAQRFYKIQEQY